MLYHIDVLLIDAPNQLTCLAVVCTGQLTPLRHYEFAFANVLILEDTLFVDWEAVEASVLLDSANVLLEVEQHPLLLSCKHFGKLA